MKTKLLMIALLMVFSGAIISTQAATFIKEDFEKFPTLAKTLLPGWDGPAAPGIMYVTDQQKSSGSKSLQLDYLPQNTQGSTYMYGWFKDSVTKAPTSAKDVYVMWHQRWSANYQFGKICNKILKISQYFGGEADKGRGEFIPETGWGGNQLWIAGLRMKEPDNNGNPWGNKNYTQNIGTPVGFERERWYTIEVHAKWNTPGVKDGVLEAWIDGVKKISYTGREFIGSGPTDCNSSGCNSYLSTFNYIMITGNQCEMLGKTDIQYSWYDNVTVSTQRIGTTVGDTVVPAAPTSLIATAKSLSQIDLSWKDNSNNETGFEIWKKVSPTGALALAGSVPANQTNYSVTGLGANHTFYFQVRAVNVASGGSAYTNEVNATTSASAIIAEEMDPQGRPIRSPVLEIHGGNVRITLPGSGAYQLSVYDLAGRKVWEQMGPASFAGTNYTVASIQNVQMGMELKDGVYFVRLQQGTKTMNTRFCIVR